LRVASEQHPGLGAVSEWDGAEAMLARAGSALQPGLQAWTDQRVEDPAAVARRTRNPLMTVLAPLLGAPAGGGGGGSGAAAARAGVSLVAMQAAPHQTELMFLLTTLLGGRRKTDVARILADAGLVPEVGGEDYIVAESRASRRCCVHGVYDQFFQPLFAWFLRVSALPLFVAAVHVDHLNPSCAGCCSA